MGQGPGEECRNSQNAKQTSQRHFSIFMAKLNLKSDLL